MLRGPAMRWVLVPCAVVLASSAASAGPYVGLGLGPSAGLGTDIPEHVDQVRGNGRAGRLFGGYRFGKFSAEAGITWFDALWRTTGPQNHSTKLLSLSGKYNHSLGSGFEVFGRVGVQHTTHEADGGMTYSGKGLLGGGGVEYRIKVPALAAASIFLDYTLTTAGLTPADFSLNTRVWTLGAIVGF